MPRFQYVSLIPASVPRVFAWHEREAAFEDLAPADGSVKLLSKSAKGLKPGTELLIELRTGPFRQEWLARHTEYKKNQYFKDVQLRGPFKRWEHTHRFDLSGKACRYSDTVEYELPYSPLSDWVVGWAVCRQIKAIFAARHRKVLEAFQK